MQRARCSISVAVLENLITAHKVSLADEDFLDRDIETVVAHYKVFSCPSPPLRQG